MFFFSMLFSCDPEENIPTPPAPVASFTKDPNLKIIADRTNVSMINKSTGEIDSYFWEFEGGKGTSSQKSPKYVFDFEGAREVKLTVTGPGGTSEATAFFVVYPFDPNCNNVNRSSTHLGSRIERLRENNLIRKGYIKIKNDYNNAVNIVLYSPSDWLSGRYTGRHTYSLTPGAEGYLSVNGSRYSFSNEWGIRLSQAGGFISCIRTVGAIANFDGTTYRILSSNIVEG